MQIKKLRIIAVATAAFATVGLFGGPALSVTLEEIFAEIAAANRIAQISQVRIDGLSEETAQLLAVYKTVLKEIEGLRVYNRQLQRQIDSQNEEMSQLRDSIERVTLIERQITPLMVRMIDALVQFVDLDVPFLMDERRERIRILQDMMGRADVSPSEKFRRVFEAYQIENDYGRTIEAYAAVLPVSGGERSVNILRIGRIALLYQTTDGSLSGVWNKNTNTWEALGDEYRSAIDEGIRIASQQTAPNMVRLPVLGPEDVR